MALAIATNNAALKAAASASSVNRDMETSMARLSTGKRINSASDDAAGVAISSRLSAEIRGTDQAIRNSMDGQALIDTAEGAHKEIENILQRMREVAVQAANDTNNDQDRANLQAEMNAMITEIDRIAGTTTWAGAKLMEDSAGTDFSFQVGAATEKLNRIEITIDAMTGAELGLTSAGGSTASSATPLGASDFSAGAGVTYDETTGTITVTDPSATIAVAHGVGDVTAASGGSQQVTIPAASRVGENNTSDVIIDIHAKFEKFISGSSSTSSSSSSLFVEATIGFDADTTGSDSIVDWGGTQIVIPDGTRADKAQDLFTALQTIVDGTSYDLDMQGDNAVRIYDIAYESSYSSGSNRLEDALFPGAEDYLHEYYSSISGSSTFANWLNGALSSSSSMSSISPPSNYYFQFSGSDWATASTANIPGNESIGNPLSPAVTYTEDTGAASLSSTASLLASELSTQLDSHGVSFTVDGENIKLVFDNAPAAAETRVSSGDISGIAVADNGDGEFGLGTALGGATNAVTVDGVSLNVDGNQTISNQAEQIQNALTAAGNTSVTVTALGGDFKFTYAPSAASSNSQSQTTGAVAGLSVTDDTAATGSINAIDRAIEKVNIQRSKLGAISNRLNHTMNNLTNISSNLSAAKGGIEDADFALETTQLAKNQILQQASTAMLAQANASKQNVLSLLQG
jgi:flagellin